MNKKMILGIGAFISTLILSIVLFVSFTVTIPAGYTGIVYSMRGGIEGDTLGQGIHFVSPIKKITKYSTSIEQGYLSLDDREGSRGDESFSVPTKDGKQVKVDLEFAYNFILDELPKTFTKFKGQDGNVIERTFMKGKLKTWAGEVTARYSVIDIYGEKRAEINKSILEYIKPKFKEYGINIETVNLSRVGLDEQTEIAIQKRVDAQQKLEEEKTLKEKAVIAAERKRIEAKGKADAKVIEAEGNAQANEKMRISLTPELVEYKKLEKWNGVLPNVTGADSVINLMK